MKLPENVLNSFGGKNSVKPLALDDIEQMGGDDDSDDMVDAFAPADKPASAGASVEATRKALKASSKGCLIDPRKPFSQKWDMYTMLLLAYTAIVTPFEVAFLQPPCLCGEDSVASLVLFAVNRAVDLSFLCDMVMQFFLMYFDEDTLEYVADKRRIGWRYLSGWFLLDLVSVMPFDTIKSHTMMGGEVGTVLAQPRLIGPRWFYRGYLPACAGQGIIMLVQMPLVEELRRQMGLDAI